MFIVVHHTITDPETAFARGQHLLDGTDAPARVRVREFYPVGGQIGRRGARLRRHDARQLQPERVLRGRRRAGSRASGSGGEPRVAACREGASRKGRSFGQTHVTRDHEEPADAGDCAGR